MTSPDQLGPGDFPVQFGRYTLLGLLGEGGMARVFDAEINGPQGFRKPAAVKVVKGAIGAADESRRKSLVREARLGGLLHHPAIVETYDFGEVEGHLFIAMELVRGAPLDRLLAEAGRFPPSIALQVAIAMCEALDHAHRATLDGKQVNLVHRDLKPGNVLVSRRGEVKVADFGIAKAGLDGGGTLTATGVAKGTPYYMSPEQASGEPVDPRSDLFALGTMLHEMVTGQRLHQGDSLPAIAMALILVDERMATQNLLGPVDEFVPGLAPIVARCVRRNPDERYATAAEVAVDLRVLLASVPQVPMLEFLEACGVGRDEDEHDILAAETIQPPPVVGATRLVPASRPAVAAPPPVHTQTLSERPPPSAPAAPSGPAERADGKDPGRHLLAAVLALGGVAVLALIAVVVVYVQGSSPAAGPTEADALPPEPSAPVAGDATGPTSDAPMPTPDRVVEPAPGRSEGPTPTPTPAATESVAISPAPSAPVAIEAPVPRPPEPEAGADGPPGDDEPGAAVAEVPTPASLRITADDASRGGKRGGKLIVNFSATAECPTGCSVKVFSRANNQDAFVATPMTSIGGNDYVAEVKFTGGAAGHLKYYIEAMATDGQRAVAGSASRPRDFVLR